MLCPSVRNDRRPFHGTEPRVRARVAHGKWAVAEIYFRVGGITRNFDYACKVNDRHTRVTRQTTVTLAAHARRGLINMKWDVGVVQCQKLSVQGRDDGGNTIPILCFSWEGKVLYKQKNM